MCRSTTPWLILASVAMLLGALMTSGQQYDPRALTRPPEAAPAQEEFDEFALQWPIVVPSPQGQITIYQPQMEDLVGDLLSARAAVSIAQPNAEPVFGVVWFNSRIATDRISRVVTVLDVTITQTRIPDADAGTERALSDAIGQAMTQSPMDLSLDQLLAMLETANLEGQDPANLASDAPRILFVDHPAIKVQYDGQPLLVPVEKSPLQRVANTPFFVVLDPGSNTYFLKGGGVWYEARDPLGPFRRASRVPQEAVTYADEFGYQDPQEPLPAAQLERLEIITATEPTELVWTDGPPQMGTVPGTGLLYVTNTVSDVFMTVDSQRTYVLLSGRWYEAPGRNGPWTFVPPDRLPADFARIPPNSPRGDALAHVAGTPQAREAVADTYVPQTAAVSRSQFEQPVIEYDGDPRFEPVEGAASLSYAVNSPQSVVVVDRRYYACYNAVWYVADSPRGRWDLCTDVPEVIYTIPPSCPIYPVRYVYVYDYTPEYVYCGYTPGYVGCYVYDGVVVYGTGHRYRPWHGRHYYARPYTFGFGARYNSYVNHWGFSVGFSTGGGSLWLGYSEGSWARRDPWFGYGGYRPVLVRNDVRRDLFRYNYRDRGRDRDRDRGDRTNITIINEQNTYIRNVNVYERRNDVRRVEPARTRVARAERDAPRGRVEERNNVLADREGRVYRRTGQGDWEVRENRQWRREGRAPAPETVERRPAARQGGQEPIVAAARTPDPESPRAQRRPADPVRGADRPVIRTEREGRGAELPAARGGGARGRGEDQPEARGAPARRGQPDADRQTPTVERETPPPPMSQDRGGRGRGAQAERDERQDDRSAGGQGARGDRGRGEVATPPPPAREGARAQENRPAEPRGRGRAAEATPPARQGPAARGDEGERGRGRSAEAPAPRREGPAARGDQADQGGRGRGRGQDRAAAPSQRELREVERDFRARQSAENRLPNYQRRDQASETPARGRGQSPPERAEPPARGRDEQPGRGRGADREDGRGRGGGNPDRGRG